jgi:hypothetical protein
MKRINFNQGWIFQKAGASEWQAVTIRVEETERVQETNSF